VVIDTLTDILGYTVLQVLKGEKVSIRFLQFTFALGVALILNDVVSQVSLSMLATILVTIALLHLYFRSKLENMFNDAMRSLIIEAMDVKKALDFTDSVLFKGRNLLEDILNSNVLKDADVSQKDRMSVILRYFATALCVIAPNILLFTLILVLILIVGKIAPNTFLNINNYVGLILMLLSYVITLILRFKPIELPTQSAEREPELYYLTTSTIERYVYGNLYKTRTVVLSLISLMLLLFLPMTRIDLKVPTMWFGLYMCSGKLADLINYLKNANIATVEEDLTDVFFKCNDTSSLEKWVELQEISPEEALEKVLGRGNSSKQSPTLKVAIKEDSNIVAYIILRAWKGCKIHKGLKKDRGSGYKLVITDTKGWRLLSIFIIGIREYVENLKTRIELAAHEANVENVLCEEQ